MLPISDTMNRYHDKRRRIEYIRIKKMLNMETSMSDCESKSSDTESISKKIKEIPPGMDNLLANLEISNSIQQ